MTIQAISRRDSQSGFTMIELIVVMIIIGIMAVTVLPRFDLLKGYDEIGFRDRVKATLEYARKAAVAQRRYTCVTVNAGGNGLILTRDVADPDTRTPATVSCPNGGINQLQIPGGNSNEAVAPASVILAVPPAAVIFDPLGRAGGSAAADCAPAVTTAYCYSVQGTDSPTPQIITVERETGYVH
jgi:MSHA pilin protein MshC